MRVCAGGRTNLWPRCQILTAKNAPSGGKQSSEGDRRELFARYENVMLLAKIASGRRDDGSFAEEDFTIGLQRLTHVVFTHEFGRRLR